MRRGWSRTAGATATMVAALGVTGGCAALVGLDETFDARDDAADGGGTDGAATTDGAAPGSDGGSLDDATVPFVPVDGWQVDESFGVAGWLVLPPLLSDAPPVITGDDAGRLYLAATLDQDGGVVRATPSLADGSDAGLIVSAIPGTVGDILVEGNQVYLLVSQAPQDVMSSSNIEVARFDGPSALPSANSVFSNDGGTSCIGRKILGVADDMVSVIGECSTFGEGTSDQFSFPLASDAAVADDAQLSNARPPQTVANVALADAGLWTVGFNSGFGVTIPIPSPSAAFALLESDGGVLSQGAFATDGGSVASDVLPLDDGTAMVFGVVGGDFFVAHVPGADSEAGATPSPVTSFTVSSAAALLQDPASRTRLVTARSGDRLLVGAIASSGSRSGDIAVVGLDGGFAFATDFALTSHLIALPQSASLAALGGVVVSPSGDDDDLAYVAATVTFPGYRRLALLRLLHHVGP